MSPLGRRAVRCAACFPASALLCALAGVAEAAYTTLVDHGPSANRVDVVFLGDGYTADDVAAGDYADDVQQYVSYMFANTLNSDPFYRYRNFFNVHAINVVSNQSGADVPPLGIFRDTALDAKYYGDGTTERLLTVSTSKANAARNTGLAGAGFTAEMQYVTVNDTRYGGSGGSYAVFAGGNSSASEVALHEVAHSFSGLADEYGGFTSTYMGAEPSEINVTKDPTGAKWSQWLGYNQPGIGVIGAYEGARYYDAGLYRPSSNSKMRSLSRPFDAVSREKIVLDIYGKVDPFDAWTGNSSPLTDPGPLAVTLVDADVLDVEWFVDGVLVPAAVDESFDLAAFGFGPGVYTVSARGFDPTAFDPLNGWVRKTPGLLEQFVAWQVTLTAPGTPGDFDHDGAVDGDDFLAWQRDPAVGNLADWQANYGVMGGVSAATVVPEPATAALVAVASTALARIRRRGT